MFPNYLSHSALACTGLSLLLSVLKTKQSKTKKQAVRKKRKKRQQKIYIENKYLIRKSFQAFGYPLTLFSQSLTASCGAEFPCQ